MTTVNVTKTRSIQVYTTQKYEKSFSVILILVVMFTVVIFGQISSKKRITFTVLGIFGHFTRSFSVIFIRSF